MAAERSLNIVMVNSQKIKTELASKIEHTNLQPDCSAADIERLCLEAKTHRFKAVCVPPYFVKMAAGFLEGSDVLVATVVGFPFGYQLVNTKVDAAKYAIEQGATDIDAVINISAIKSGDWRTVEREIESLGSYCKMYEAQSKIILETALLSPAELERSLKLIAESEINFAKTSTGFAKGGATVEDVKMMRSMLPSHIGIKASGGIKTLDFALELVAAGADRLGTSKALEILEL